MLVIVGDRRTGRTSILINWLLMGHSINMHPGWSRMVITSNPEHFLREVQNWYRSSEHGTDFALEGLKDIVIRGDYRTLEAKLRGMSYDIEIGFDDADLLLSHLLGRNIAAVTMTGRALTTPYIPSTEPRSDLVPPRK